MRTGRLRLAFMTIAGTALLMRVPVALSGSRSGAREPGTAATTKGRRPPAPITSPRSSVMRSSVPILVPQVGHSADVRCFAFSPDGKTLATGGEDGTALLWDVGGGGVRARLGGHEPDLERILFTPDGGTVITLTGRSGLATARLWDAKTGRRRSMMAGKGFDAYGVTLSPDGGILFTGCVEGVALWDSRTGRRVGTLPGAGSPLCFSPDRRILATGSRNGGPRLWRLSSGRPAVALPAGSPRAFDLAFSPDGRTVAAASWRETAPGRCEVRLWDTRTGRAKAILPDVGPQFDERLAFTADGRALVFSREGLWEPGTASPRPLPGAGEGSVVRFILSPDHRLLAVVCRLPEQRDGSPSASAEAVRLYDTTSGRFTATLQGPAAGDIRVAFSPDGRRLAGWAPSERDGGVRLWDVRTGALQRTIPSAMDGIDAVAFAPDSRRLGAISLKGIQVWDAQSGASIVRLSMGRPGGVSSSWDVKTSPDGKTLVARRGRDESITSLLWDLSSGRLQAVAPGTVDFSDDGSLVVVSRLPKDRRSGQDGEYRVWDAQKWQPRSTLRGLHDTVYVVAFSPDGRTLATGSAEAVQWWDPQTGKARAALPGGRGAVAYSPDGRLLATDGEGGSILVWDAVTGQQKMRLSRESDEPPGQLLFAPDGRTLAACGSLSVYAPVLGAVELWDLASGRLKGKLPERASAAAFSRDGKRLVVTGVLPIGNIGPRNVGNVDFRLWDVEAGKLIPVARRADVPSGLIDARPAGETIVLHDPRTGREVAALWPLFVAGAAQERPASLGVVAEDWLITTPEGYVNGSPRALSLIRWNVDGVLHPFERFAARFYRPDLVRRAIEGVMGREAGDGHAQPTADRRRAR